MDIRPYTPSDRHACLAIFDTKEHLFAPTDKSNFTTFLDHLRDPYFVMEHDADIVGCGGFAISGDGASARLLWGMIHRDLQKQGLGRFLLMFRLREIGKFGNVQVVQASASNKTVSFFEKQGFRRAATFDDRVELVKKLIVCS